VAEAVGQAWRQLAAGLKSGAINESDPRCHLLHKVVEVATTTLVDAGCSKEHASAQISHRFRAPRKRRSLPITS
jgi:hypothetical protein